MSRLLSAFLCGALFCLLSAPLAAQQVAPLPAGDLSHLTPGQADLVRGARADFDRLQADAQSTERADLFGKIAAVYARMRVYPVAEVALANAAQLVPLDGRWPYQQGVVARFQDKDAQARGFFERSFELNPDYLPARIALAGALTEAGELDRARRIVDEYLARHPDEPAAHAVLGDIAMYQKRPADAVTAFQRVLQLDPEATALYQHLAAAHAAAGNTAAAEQARKRSGDGLPRLDDRLLQMMVPVVDAPASSVAPRADDVLGSVAGLMAEGDVAGARAALQAGLRNEPDNVAYLTTLARVELADGKSDAAVRHAQRAVRVDANDAQAQLIMGLVAEVRGDATAAQAAYHRSVTADTSLVEARYRLANLLMRGGKHAQAAEQYRQLIVLNPAAAEYRARLAAAQAASNQCRAALGDINEAMRGQPDDDELMVIFVRLASTCPQASQDERDMALDYATQLYRGNQSPWISETLALAYAAQGRWLEAVETQEAAIFAIVIRDPDARVDHYREFLTTFNEEKVPSLPWPRSSVMYQPPVPHAGIGSGTASK